MLTQDSRWWPVQQLAKLKMKSRLRPNDIAVHGNHRGGPNVCTWERDVCDEEKLETSSQKHNGDTVIYAAAEHLKTMYKKEMGNFVCWGVGTTIV